MATTNSTSDETTIDETVSYEKGTEDAKSLHSTIGFKIGGLLSGILLGPVGMAGVTLVAVICPSPVPDFVPNEVDPMAYTDGYSQEAYKMNIRNAVGFSAIGTGVLLSIATVVILVIVNTTIPFGCAGGC